MTVIHLPRVLSLFFALSSRCESGLAMEAPTSALPSLRFTGSLNQTAINVLKKNKLLSILVGVDVQIFKRSRKLQ